MKRVVRHWKKLERWSHHLWRDLKEVWLWYLGTWFTGELGSAGGMLGLHELRELFQAKNPCKAPWLSVPARVSTGRGTGLRPGAHTSADIKLAMHSSVFLPKISLLQHLGLPSAGLFTPPTWRITRHGKGWIPQGIQPAMSQAGHQQGKVQWVVCTTQSAILPQPLEEMEEHQGSDSKQHCLVYLSQKQHWSLNHLIKQQIVRLGQEVNLP